MADIDLYRDAYRTKLGRDASDDELQGWVSGQFGGGSVQDRLNQIASSGEAQAYRPPQQSPAPVLGPSPTENHAMPAPAEPQANPLQQQIEDWYQQYLGRGSQQGDIEKWLSGGYGWGDQNNLAGIKSGIMGSTEARNRPGATSTPAPTTPYQNLDYWSAQGVPQSEMFDLTTGQLKPGWTRTAKGYEREGGATTGGTNTSGDLQSWLQSTLTGMSSPQALAALEPELNKRGIRLQKDSAGNVRGRLYLPDGTTLDVVSQWGQPWAFTNRGKGGGDGGGGVQMPGGQYSDPYTGLLEAMLKMRMGNLGGGVNDPYAAMYQSALQQRANALGGANTQVEQLMKYLQERFTALQGPGYTGAENEVLRTQALDPMEQDRNAARKRVIERLAARNIGPDSGVYQDALMQVDKAFDTMRGETQGALATNELARREDRSQRAQIIGGQLVDIPEARKREQLDVFSALEQLSQTMRAEEDARQRESLGYAGVLSDLGPQRLQLALQAMGAGGSPESLGSSLFNIANLNQNAALLNQRNSGSLWSGLGSVAAILANSGRR